MFDIKYSPTKPKNKEQRMVQHKVKIIIKGKRYLKSFKKN